MKESRIVPVRLGARSYDIEIGTETLERFGAGLQRYVSAKHVVVVTDDNIKATYATTLVDCLRRVTDQVDLLSVPPGESSKSVDAADQLWKKLLTLGADRQTVIVAAGGGVVGDLAGFVAAGFARGVPFAQVPTTLLAQVDSSVGGKVGINLPSAKNMVGAFWQPRYVLVDTAVLQTLPEREYRAGLAEVVKYGVILDSDFFGLLADNVESINQRQNAVLRQIVARCCELKAMVVEADETETSGTRAALNYGHTFAHAFEVLAKYTGLLHGEAVSMGMHCAGKLAVSLDMLSSDQLQRQADLLKALHLPLEHDIEDADAIVRIMRHDKKAESGRIRFILPTRIGHVEMRGDVPEELLRSSLVD